jgi:hypothetical protein
LAQRLKPLGTFGVGVLVFVLNLVTIIFLESYYPVMLVFAFGMMGAGAFGTVFGEPSDAAGNRPIWYKVGVAVFAIGAGIIGLGLGAFFAD